MGCPISGAHPRPCKRAGYLDPRQEMGPSLLAAACVHSMLSCTALHKAWLLLVCDDAAGALCECNALPRFACIASWPCAEQLRRVERVSCSRTPC